MTTKERPSGSQQTKNRIQIDKHCPVSNQSEAQAVIEKVKPEQPSIGKKDSISPTKDGREAIEGYVPASPTGQRTIELMDSLRDIVETSFGPPPETSPTAFGLEAVIGVDDRVQIQMTNHYPWRAHASLLITARDGSMWIGTGWFIGPHTLMTAGHVVYIKESGIPERDGWVKSILVMPGRNKTELPYGSVTSTSFRSVPGWTEDGDENYDYGAILIPTNLGDTVGWLGFNVHSDEELCQSIGNIAGYPGDKPPGTQWYHSRQITRVDNMRISYDIDTTGGQSGSAVYHIEADGSRSACAYSYLWRHDNQFWHTHYNPSF